MQAFDLSLQRLQIVVIDQHIVSVAKAIFATGLSLENGLHLLLGGVVAQLCALYLHGLGRIDHQYALGCRVLP